MKKVISEFLTTKEYPKADLEPVDLVFEKSDIIGKPVKVLRTGQTAPEEGWHIAEIFFKDGKKRVDHTYVKVKKPDPHEPKKGLEKNVSLTNLKETNPEINLLLFELNKDYIIYKDRDEFYKIGLIVDANLEDNTLLVMLSPDSDGTTAPLDRIKTDEMIDKNTDPKRLEKIFHEEIKAYKDTRGRSASSRKRVSQRKNLLYYLKVVDNDSGKSMGHAANISKHGILLITKELLEPEVVFHMKLSLPAEIQGSRHLVFTAISRWCQKDVKPRYYNVGFQFVGLTMEDSLVIDELIDQYSF